MAPLAVGCPLEYSFNNGIAAQYEKGGSCCVHGRVNTLRSFAQREDACPLRRMHLGHCYRTDPPPNIYDLTHAGFTSSFSSLFIYHLATQPRARARTVRVSFVYHP